MPKSFGHEFYGQHECQTCVPKVDFSRHNLLSLLFLRLTKRDAFRNFRNLGNLYVYPIKCTIKIWRTFLMKKMHFAAGSNSITMKQKCYSTKMFKINSRQLCTASSNGKRKHAHNSTPRSKTEGKVHEDH